MPMKLIRRPHAKRRILPEVLAEVKVVYIKTAMDTN